MSIFYNNIIVSEILFLGCPMVEFTDPIVEYYTQAQENETVSC